MVGNDEPLFDSGEDSGPGSRNTVHLQDRVRRLVGSQPYAVLCTQSQAQPYGALVAFAFAQDLKQAVFATPVATRKYRILSECDHVALLVDNRPQHVGDFMSVEAVTVTGRAVHLEDEAERETWARLLVERHPYLGGFVAAPTSALFRVDIVRFLHVTRFQEVRQWIP